PPPTPLDDAVITQVTIETKFEGYLAKQRNQVARVKRLEAMPIPANFDFSVLKGLRAEAQQKLARFQPTTLGQASRIAGVNPADISILLVHLERQKG
ncbi:MAG: tRNA uridine-5-carboxymethylaminomethyl(34) synthesis enzyme MnmG, partial [Chloroflexota bacterium]